jgi:steroid delta-isomerase-like uncharacterized protein
MADLRALYLRGFEEMINGRRLELADELLAENYVNYNMPAPAPGPAGFKQMLGMFFNAFPDMRVDVQDVIVDGDKVAGRGTWTGTHQGDFMGIPATGKQVSVPFIDIWRADGDRMVENWVQMDMLGLMQQLGVGPGQ